MIILTNQILIPKTYLSKSLIKEIKSDLTLQNPALAKRIQLNLRPLSSIPSNLKFYKENEVNLMVPIGYGPTLMKKVSSVPISDRRESGSRLPIKFKAKLREYQQDVLDILKDRHIGVVSAPTGSGKTVMMSALIAQKAVTTLVLVHTKELANQFRKSLIEFTDLKDDDVKIISADKKEKAPVTICLLQQYYRLNENVRSEYESYFGMVLTDEVHIVGATTYYDIVSSIPAKLKFGFTATPERGDGLDACIFLASGPIIKKIGIKDIQSHVLKPTLDVRKTDYHFPLFDVSEYTAMITDLSNDEDRNNLITNVIKENQFKKKQKVLLCSRVMQCVHLQQKIPGSKILVGSISKQDREMIKLLYKDSADEILKQRGIVHRRNVVKELNSGKLNTVISTFSLFSTGLDFKNLEVAAFCAPLKSKILVKQCRGRVMRTGKDGKAPICLEFEDHKVGLLKNQSRLRQRILRNFE